MTPRCSEHHSNIETTERPFQNVDMLTHVWTVSAVTLREVGGDPEELRALQTVMESDENFALRITRHPPGLAEDGVRRDWRGPSLAL